MCVCAYTICVDKYHMPVFIFSFVWVQAWMGHITCSNQMIWSGVCPHFLFCLRQDLLSALNLHFPSSCRALEYRCTLLHIIFFSVVLGVWSSSSNMYWGYFTQTAIMLPMKICVKYRENVIFQNILKYYLKLFGGFAKTY